MAKKEIKRYYLRKNESDPPVDVTTLFDGVNILKVDGVFSLGKAVNIFTQQWIDNQEEDFLVTTLDDHDNPIVIRENVDIKVTFIVGQRYANSVIDIHTVYNNFLSYMTNSDIWITRKDGNIDIRCIALDRFDPQTIKLQRGDNSYILGEITLHTLNKPA